MVDILAVEGDERRLLESDMLRRALKHAVTRRFLNEVTHLMETLSTAW